MTIPAVPSLAGLLSVMQADIPRVKAERHRVNPSKWSQSGFLGGARECGGIEVCDSDGSVTLTGTRAGHLYLFEEMAT